MSAFLHLITFIWVPLQFSAFPVLASSSWYPYHFFVRQINRQFEQKTDRFWEFDKQSNGWVELKLPYDLVSCVDDNCTKVGTIRGTRRKENMGKEDGTRRDREENLAQMEDSDMILKQRKRISLTKMSETSIWVTGQSGSIYERFWNGVQWVLGPHELPTSAGPAVSVFAANQTVFALSEAGVLYQMQLSENSNPIWVEISTTQSQSANGEANQLSDVKIESAVVSDDGLRVYFCTKKLTLLELSEIDPPRWINHGRPPGADVSFIVDASSIRTDVVYTISSRGDLYEYERSSKPLWKRHIWTEGAAKDSLLMPSSGCSFHSRNGDSVSLFLLTKGGDLVERRLFKRKWKWITHGRPKDHHLTSITIAVQDDSNEKDFSLFSTTSTGSVFEYPMPSHSETVSIQGKQNSEAWVSHLHPLHTKVAKGIVGMQFQVGRMLFALDDGRLAELHLPGFGGESRGPTHSSSSSSSSSSSIHIRRKAPLRYIWSVLDAPETEGWNAEYCTDKRGPTNCVAGTKDDVNDSRIRRSGTRRTKESRAQETYLIPSTSGSQILKSAYENNFPSENWVNSNFRLRVMQAGRSFLLVTEGGLTFEYLYAEDVWIWLRHESPTPMRGVLGNYNGSLYLVDAYGSVLIRERSSNELAWINCTALRRGKQVAGGPPWDRMSGVAKVTAEDALFFVGKTGRLLQFTVSLRKFRWRDCKSPADTKVASIVDQERFRDNIVFVVGRNGRLYQYNRVTELWHEHQQSQHLVLSRVLGTATRPSFPLLAGSIFTLSEDGGLVEYHWSAWDGWNWVEHGKPYKDVMLVTAPGPCFQGNQLFLIGSDGNVYLRYMDQLTWKWRICGFPYARKAFGEEQGQSGVCVDQDSASSFVETETGKDNDKNCDPKVSSTRPIQFSEDAVIFELRDGRLAELQQTEDSGWIWSRIIGTPTSLCVPNFWTTLAP